VAVPVGVKVGAFALAVMGVYTWYANSIPQIESKPPEELSLEGGAVTREQLVAAGEKIFREKGQCTTCHGIGQAGRGPDLAGVGGRAGSRKPGTSAKAYLIEALLDPGAFVVPGFPNIMPRIDRPPIGLNRSELWATVAYLESLGGTVDVALEDIPATAGGGAGAAAAPFQLPGDPKKGQAVFAGKGTCIACHRAGALGGGQVGPDLSNIGGSQTVEYVMGKILNPASKGVVSGFPAGVMPPTFGTQLTAQEYVDLVAFLMTLKGGPATPGAGRGAVSPAGPAGGGARSGEPTPAAPAKPGA
jgi:mono/diheme cytochrome c family protein